MRKKILIGGIVIVIIIIIAVLMHYFSDYKKEKRFDFSDVILNNLTEEENARFLEVKEKLAKNPQDVESLITLATLQKYNGDFEAAIETLNLAEEIQSENLIILNNQMDIYFMNKKIDKAENKALQIIEINTQWMNAYRTLNDIYKFHKNDIYYTDKFPNLLKEAIKTDYTGVNKKTFTAILAEYYKDIHNKEQALEWYQKYYEIAPSEEAEKIIEEINNWQ